MIRSLGRASSVGSATRLPSILTHIRARQMFSFNQAAIDRKSCCIVATQRTTRSSWIKFTALPLLGRRNSRSVLFMSLDSHQSVAASNARTFTATWVRSLYR